MEFAIQVGGGQAPHDKTGLEAIVEETQLAEELGFDVTFVPDHYVFESVGNLLMTEMPAYELFLAMATLAQRTKRIRIGSHVACLLFRHPVMHARLFAQLDEASGGRVIAGVGAGWTRAEFEMMGLEFPDISERLRIMDEAVEIMRGLWREERFSFTGRYFRLTDAVCLPKPVQRPGPPLMLGGGGNGILRRAGTWADIIHMVPVLGAAGTATFDEIRKFDDDGLADKLARVRAAEAKAGRTSGTVRFASTVFTYSPTDSPAQTAKIAEGMAGAFGLSPDAFRRHPVALIGTPEEMIEELRRREKVHGLSLLALNFSNAAQLRDFGERVLPHVR
jgi:probable F420-dependent oxidoreductase